MKNMKATRILFATFMTGMTLFTMSSCKKVKQLANVDISLTAADINLTIPQINATGSSTLSEVNVPLNVDSIIKANNAEFAMKNIKSVKMKSCTITMLDGDAANNFSALESAEVLFASNAVPTLTTIATISGNPDVESYTITVPVNTSVDLKNYFNTSSYTYRLTGNARKTTSKPIQCKATIKYTLNVGL